MDSTTIINQQQDEPTGHGSTTVKSSRSTALNTLAIVGFLALIFIGIGLAIYSSQFIPTAVSKLSSNTNSPIGVVPTNHVTIPFNSPATTTTLAASNEATSTPTTFVPVATAQPSTGPSYAATAGAAHALYGLPNLTTRIVAVGYLANGSNASFVPSPVIPVGARAAVQFTIGNTGTNSTGPWNFIAQIPTDNGYLYTSPTEENMNPGDHILFTLAFDQVPPGNSEPAIFIADPRNFLQETTKSDNTATAVLTVAQS
jgi:hypothetical protein